jgi:signal transduction histidine kinase
MVSPRKRAWVLIAAVLAVHLVVSLGLGRGYAPAAFGNGLQSLLLGVWLAITLLNIRSTEGHARLFWVSMAFGACLWLFATVMWMWLEVIVRQPVPVPFTGDVLFFLHVVPMMGALALRPHRSDRLHSVEFGSVDYLLLILWWVYLYFFLVTPWQYVALDPDRYNLNFNVLYVIEHMVYLGPLALVYSHTRGGWRRIYGGLLAAGAVYAIGSQICNFEIAANRYYTGSLFDLPLVASMMMFIVVGLDARAHPPEPMTEPGSRLQGVIASRLAMLVVISLPFMAIWATYAHTPPPVRRFRHFVTAGALVVLPILVFLKQHRLDRRLMRLWQESQHNYENLKRLQAQLVQAEKLAALGQLVSGAAHQINNPLTAIIGYSDLLADHSGDTADQQGFAVKIGQQARRVRKVVDDLRSFAKHIPSERVPLDLNNVLKNAIELRSLDLRENVRIEQELAAPLPRVMGDYNGLLQVCFHIIGNALEALQQIGGGVLRVSSRQQDSQVVLEFADSGPGIKDPQRIFDPFYSTKPVGRGTGLGLSACYGIVQEHNGRIECENPPGGGAKFTVILPVFEPDRTGSTTAT